MAKRVSRRTFLAQCGAATMAASATARTLGAQVTAPARADKGAVKNRAPLAPNAFYLLPLGAIRPQGWLLDQLTVQANGLGGHLDETWADVGPNSGWLGGTGESWERGPYFLDGLVPLAYLLDDARLKAKVQPRVEWILNSQDASGMMGPKTNNDWWPRMVMLKALTQYAEATGDSRVVPAMTKYLHHHAAEMDARPLVEWGKYRWHDENLSILWLYNRTGDPALLTLARGLQKQGFDWEAQFADFKYTQPCTREYLAQMKAKGEDISLRTHGVNNAMAMKAAPVAYSVSGSATDRAGMAQMLAMLDRYHGLPNGMFSADEHLAGLDPSHGTELCTVVEAMFSLEQSLAILGDAELGDRLERMAFNALPGTFTDDMWAHQYNQEPNQVECSLHWKPWTTDGPESNLYGLEPNFGCCTANFHQGWPKFATSLVMLSADGGLAVAAYAPCSVETTVRGGTVRMGMRTEYPFDGVVRLSIDPDAPLRFPLRLRVPGWAAGTTIRVNGKPFSGRAAPASYAVIERAWQPGDVVELAFPMTPRVTRGFNQSASVERGPLVFSYPVPTDWLKLRDRGMTADWQVYPSGQWGYALALNGANPQIDVRTSALKAGVTTGPFTEKGAPVQLAVKARRLPAWDAEDGVAKTLPEGPVASTEPEQTLTLVPYAAAKLRITAFPVLKES